MRAQLAQRLRASSLSAVPPPQSSRDYDSSLARIASSILYRSPIPSAQSGLPIYILNAAAFPDTGEVDYDALLPYVLARLPGEEELISGQNYDIVFFAGGGGEGGSRGRSGKGRPGWGWFVQAYHVLSRAMRKRLKMLWIVHERSWVRILVEMFSTIVSPKFRRKIQHVSTLSNLALFLPIENLLIPPSAYLHDRRLSPDIYSPYVSGRRAFAVRRPLPRDVNGNPRLPRVLRETSAFVLQDENVKTEGLFRIPPHSKLKEVVREAYDRGQKFIVWKDYQSYLPPPPYRETEDIESIMNEVDQLDAYSVHMAAGICKFWYAELRVPIIPQQSYKELRDRYGDPHYEPTMQDLTNLFSPKSEWSPLTKVSRQILTRHLFPFLSVIASYQEYNKMTEENLAICFAPTMVCGPDQIEDAKMSSIIKRILASAIEAWASAGLREVCGVDTSTFMNSLKLPQDPRDWEDPLEDPHAKSGISEHMDPITAEKQFSGIIMKDNEAEEERAQIPPPLPPRPGSQETVPRGASGETVPSGRLSGDDETPKRKPAPPVMVPPRYSTIIGDNIGDVAESPVSYAAVTDGFGPYRPSGWTIDTVDEKPPAFDDKKEPIDYPTDEKKQIDEATEGAQSFSSASAPSAIVLPKRKALTVEQVGNVDKTSSGRQNSGGQGRVALPGLTLGGAGVKRKPVVASQDSSPTNNSPTNDNTNDPALTTATTTSRPRQISASSTNTAPTSPSAFRKPSWPASQGPGGRRPSNPAISITSLARPMHPPQTLSQSTGGLNTSPSQHLDKPPVGPKPRTPSPSLLKRMPSFESRGSDTSPPSRSQTFPTSRPGLAPPSTPGRLRKSSVEDLRRVFEEKQGLAQVLASKK